MSLSANQVITSLLNTATTQPSEALSTAGQIATALAGFASVVTLFQRGLVHEWSPGVTTTNGFRRFD
jgi:hypothetical protein